MDFIKFERVFKRYNSRSVIDDFSLQIGGGERLVILGPSGCGKTTVLRLLAGFIGPDAGRIVIGDETVAEDGKIIREPEERNLGMVFQDLALWPHLSVKGNLEFGLKAGGIPTKEREKRIIEVLRLIQMEDSAGANVTELSGGEQQRIALGRALILNPKVLLMDEPLSSLDFELNLQLRKEILRLQAQFSFTLVYVTHNLEEAFDLASRIVVMKHGRIDQVGTPGEISKRFEQIHQRIADRKEVTPK